MRVNWKAFFIIVLFFTTTVALTYFAAQQFDSLTYNALLMFSAGYFIISTFASFFFLNLNSSPTSWNQAFLSSVFLIALLSIFYSFYSCRCFIFFIPLLFIPSGVAIGGAHGIDLAMKKKAI